MVPFFDDNTQYRLGIIAGDGDLPHIICHNLHKRKNVFIIYIGKHPSLPEYLSDFPCEKIPMSRVGKIIHTFKKHNVTHIVLAGTIARPKWSELRPDAKGMILLTQIYKTLSRSDHTIFSSIIAFLEKEKFTVLGAHHIVPELLAPAGFLTALTCSNKQLQIFAKGKEIAKSIGALDIGQSIIFAEGVVIGVEAVEGTDALLKRCTTLLNPDQFSMLIKVKKPQQDERIDLPTIGPDTIKQAAHAQIKAVIVEAGATLLVDYQKTINLATQSQIILFGI